MEDFAIRAFTPDETPREVPVGGVPGAVLLGVALALGAVRILRRRR